jgi:hypothetical protein
MNFVISDMIYSFFHQFAQCDMGLLNFCRTKLVRLGHPARLLPQVLDSALDAQV